jgi:hypothetical protein
VIGRVSFQSTRYILVDRKETLPVNGRATLVDWKAFILVNLAGRNPSWPEDCTVLGHGGVPPSLKALKEGKYCWCQVRYLVPMV